MPIRDYKCTECDFIIEDRILIPQKCPSCECNKVVPIISNFARTPKRWS